MKDLEVAFPVNFKGKISPKNAALQQPVAPLHMQYATQGCDVSFVRACNTT